MYSADQIIPPNSQLAHDLLQWSEDADTKTWNIANITNELIWELENVATKNEVYRAVAIRCKGNKVNTIRRWAECAASFDAETQAKYASILSFNHFKVAKRLYAEGLVPTLEYPLAWCLESLDDTVHAGRPRTVNELLLHFLPQEDGYTPAALYWSKIRERLIDHVVMWDNDTEREQMKKAIEILDKVWRKNEQE